MNVQNYASIYSAFHRTSGFQIVNDTVVLSFAAIQFDNFVTMRLFEYEQITKPDLPLSKSLSVFFNNATNCTVFLEKPNSWSILLGNERVIFPKFDGNVKLFATPYFVRDPAIIHEYLAGKDARQAYENTFVYKNTLMYLDNYDVPRPGGNYFLSQNEPCEMYRCCFLSTDPPEQVWSNVIQEWKHRRGISILPFPTRHSVSNPTFIPLEPVHSIQLDNDLASNTSTIRKSNSMRNPAFLIQDILSSYQGNDLTHLGLVIEYPLRVAYDGSRPLSTCPTKKSYVCVSVNGAIPKRVLFVKDPFERYVEFEYVPDAPNWVQVLYSPQQLFDERFEGRIVSIDSTILGINYKDKYFLCLEHPLLELNPRENKNLNTDGLLSPISKAELENDEHLFVIETFQWDCGHLIHKVRHNLFPYPFWCISLKLDNELNYPKPVRIPYLVQNWLQFYKRNESKRVDFGNPKAFQFALILAKHKICFRTEISDSNSNILKVRTNEIKLKMSEAGKSFLNTLRIEAGEGNGVDETDSSCTML